jgi:molybdopterin/thiamine biosynthesis adenylyltransferase
MTSRSSNRHLRADSTGRMLIPGAANRIVLVRGVLPYLAEPAGQHLAQMTVNLLARQYGVVEQVTLDLPDVPVHSGIFPGQNTTGSFGAALEQWAKSIGGPEIMINRARAHETMGCTVIVGPDDASKLDGFGVSATAEGWRLHCTTTRAPSPVTGADPNPHGPYMAACYLANAVFKYFIGMDASCDVCASLWENTEGEWRTLPSGRSPAGTHLPTTYVIGAGAVGAACGFTLAATPGIAGDLIPLDPEASDDTNRNRLLSMTYDQLGQEKVHLLKTLFTYSNIEVRPYKGAWPDYTIDAKRATPPHIRSVEQTHHYEWVLSCVDRNIHRQAIARFHPKVILGGSTHDLTAQAAVYSMRGDCECLACNHPIPIAPATEELQAELSSMTAEQRSAWYDRHDASPRERAAVEEQLLKPGCGTIGAEMLARLIREGPTDWSVGFVSVAAGVMLSSVYLHCLMDGVLPAIVNGSEYFAWFTKPSLGRSFARRKPACNLCGNASEHDRYNLRWPG